MEAVVKNDPFIFLSEISQSFVNTERVCFAVARARARETGNRAAARLSSARGSFPRSAAVRSEYYRSYKSTISINNVMNRYVIIPRNNLKIIGENVYRMLD